MKKFEFETSKGRFVLVDDYIENGIRLKDITEEQASKVVDSINFLGFTVYEDYLNPENAYYVASESLYSLFESNCIYLFKNPFLDFETLDPSAVYAEQNTFHKPYIFKL